MFAAVVRKASRRVSILADFRLSLATIRPDGTKPCFRELGGRFVVNPTFTTLSFAKTRSCLVMK
jgi:hypothetical protein